MTVEKRIIKPIKFQGRKNPAKNIFKSGFTDCFVIKFFHPFGYFIFYCTVSSAAEMIFK